MKPGETDQLYVCQNTQIKFATQPLPWWDVRQYIEDYTSGNVRLTELVIGLLYSMYRTVAEAGIGVGSAMRWAYDQFQRVIGGVPYPIRPYGVPKGTPVPRATLDLEVGEKVRVKPYKEILKTLDSTYRNRGLYFDAEMVPFTEREYEVERRQKQIIDEASGKMIKFKTDAIILKDAVCEARYAICRRFCPRAIYPYWREIWLERVPGAGSRPRPRPITLKERPFCPNPARQVFHGEQGLCRPWPGVAAQRRDLHCRARRQHLRATGFDHSAGAHPQSA